MRKLNYGRHQVQASSSALQWLTRPGTLPTGRNCFTGPGQAACNPRCHQRRSHNWTDPPRRLANSLPSKFGVQLPNSHPHIPLRLFKGLLRIWPAPPGQSPGGLPSARRRPPARRRTLIILQPRKQCNKEKGREPYRRAGAAPRYRRHCTAAKKQKESGSMRI